MQIEVYEANTKRTKLTITLDRVTIKFSPNDSNWEDSLRKLALDVAERIPVDFSFRGGLDIQPAFITACLKNNSKTRQIMLRYYPEQSALLKTESVLVDGTWVDMEEFERV